MYLLDSGKKPSMIIKTSNIEKAIAILKENNYETIQKDEVY